MRHIDVYILDDDRDDAHIVRQLLLANGDELNYRIQLFSSILDFEKGYSKRVPDVVLLDLGLHESSGLTTLVNILGVVKECPIIVLTGFDDRELGDRAIQLGAQDFIPKSALTDSMLSRSIRFSKERFHLLESIRNLGEKDELTLLNNRRYFDNEFSSLLNMHDRYGGPFALMYLDLDRFKSVNDNYGHQVGDMILKQLGIRLRHFSRSTDIVARIGGDEFAIIIPQFENKTEITKIAQDKIYSIQQPYMVEINHEPKSISVGVSIGIAIYPTDGKNKSELLEAADRAMYEAKSRGENHYCFANEVELK